jgi:hypothetical protein
MGVRLSLWLERVEVGLLDCGSVMVRLRGAIEIVSLRRRVVTLLLEYLRHSC